MTSSGSEGPKSRLSIHEVPDKISRIFFGDPKPGYGGSYGAPQGGTRILSTSFAAKLLRIQSRYRLRIIVDIGNCGNDFVDCVCYSRHFVYDFFIVVSIVHEEIIIIIIGTETKKIPIIENMVNKYTRVKLFNKPLSQSAYYGINDTNAMWEEEEEMQLNALMSLLLLLL